MNRALHTLLTVVCGIWLGALLMLFLSVQSLFATFADQHEVFGTAASGIFSLFNKFRLIIACSALLLTFDWWLRRRTQAKMVLFLLLAVAITAAVYSAGILTPSIEHLRVAGLTQTPDFRKLHGLSMGIYLLETLLILVVNLILPGLPKQPPV